jgi:hypothetical protein
MLAGAVEEWSRLPPGPARDRLTRHLAAALQSYRRALNREVLDVEELFASVPALDETGGIPR